MEEYTEGKPEDAQDVTQDDVHEITQDDVDDAAQEVVCEITQDDVDDTAQEVVCEMTQDDVDDAAQEVVCEMTQDDVDDAAQEVVHEMTQDSSENESFSQENSTQSSSESFSALGNTSESAFLAMLNRIWEPVQEKFFNSEIETKQKVLTGSIPILFVVMSVMLFKVFSPTSPKATMAQIVEPSETIANSFDKEKWQIPEPYPENLRDPMQYGSITAAQSDSGGIQLRGIVYSEDDPSAVINGKIVRQGDKVLGATVTKINKNSVEFELEGKTWTRKVQ